MGKRLWEIKHPYYCTEGQYFSTQSNYQTITEFKSWHDFLEEWGDADKDYNFLFRWDWDELDSETGENTFNGDEYYRNGRLKLFYMLQRKGYHSCCIVDVCRADEPHVAKFLREHWEHMRVMWEPICGAAQAESEGGDD